MKKLKINKYAIIDVIYPALIFLGIIFGLLSSVSFHQPIHHYDEYRQIITTFLAGILAAILTITIFYVGKFHDYQREFITQEGVFKNSMEKCVFAFKNVSRSIDRAKSEIVLTKDENLIKESTPIFEETENHAKAIQNKMSETEKRLSVFKEIHKNFENFPRRTILRSFIDIFPFGITFMLLLLLGTNPQLGNFYFLLIVLSMGIGSFLHSWYFHERRMSILHESYRQIVDLTVDFTNMYEEANSVSEDAQYVATRVATEYYHRKTMGNKVNEKRT